MKIFLNYARLIITLAVIITFAGCIEEDANLPKVVAGFTHTVNEMGTVTFLNTSTKATKYVWSFGDGKSSTEINPINTYVPGTFFVSLTASNESGASDIFKDTLTIIILDKVTLPITFDNTNVDYDVTTFNGASFSIVDNPNVSGTNDKASKVGGITNSGVAYEGIFIDLATQADLATNKTIAMNFHATAPISVLLKLEEGTSGPIETSVTHGGTGWENLKFNFTSSAKYSRITLFVDGPGTTAGTFYIDDIEQKETEVLCTPEISENINPALGDINWTFKTNNATNTFEAFGNTSGSIVSNPVFDGINTSCNVEKLVKTAGCETWSGLGTALATALDFGVTTKKVFKMKVLAQTQVTSVTLRLEKLPFPDTEPSQDRVANITQVGVWQELTFDFSDVPSGTFKSMIIYFERNAGCDGDVYYFDDIIQVAGNAPACTAETSENINPATGDLNWTFKTSDVAHTFEAFGNTSGAIVANPVIGGVNTSCNVEKFTKAAGCETWSGLGTALPTALDFAVITKKVFKMKVLASTQVTNVTLRLERLPFPDTDPAQDRVASITQVGVWQELTFDFSDVNTGTFKSMIIYFERNAGCDGDIYYFDDIVQVAGGGGGGCTDTNLAIPINFDCPGINYAAKIVGNVSFTVLDNPVKSGINNVDSKVGRITNVGANWENAFFNLDNAVNFATNKTIKLKLYSTQALPIKLKFEGGTGGPGDVEADANHGGAGWQELTYNFTVSNTYSKMVIFVDGPGTAAGNFYVDDIIQVATSGGGGPAGIVNGNFETGDNTGWAFFDNGGQTSVTNTQSNGGTFSAKIVSGQFDNPGIKQERFGAGTILPNQQYQVKIDSKVASLLDGAIVNVLAFSESSGPGGAVLHNLGTVNVSPGNWNTNTFNFTTAGDVTGGVSLLIEVVCGGAASCNGEVFFDNLTFTIN